MSYIQHMSYRFEYIPNEKDPFDNKRVIIESCSVSLDEVVDAFESFLKASGFNFEGQHLELVENEPLGPE